MATGARCFTDGTRPFRRFVFPMFRTDVLHIPPRCKSDINAFGVHLRISGWKCPSHRETSRTIDCRISFPHVWRSWKSGSLAEFHRTSGIFVYIFSFYRRTIRVRWNWIESIDKKKFDNEGNLKRIASSRGRKISSKRSPARFSVFHSENLEIWIFICMIDTMILQDILERVYVERGCTPIFWNCRALKNR